MAEQQDEQQTALLDISSKQLDPYWVDEKQKLLIPNNPLHFKAHRLQILLDLLSSQAKKNPAQFNSKNYIDALNEYTKCIEAIKDGRNEILDESGVDSIRQSGSEEKDSEIEPISMDS